MTYLPVTCSRPRLPVKKTCVGFQAGSARVLTGRARTFGPRVCRAANVIIYHASERGGYIKTHAIHSRHFSC